MNNPVAWASVDEAKLLGRIFFDKVHAENYSAQNHVDVAPLYLENNQEQKFHFLDRFEELVEQGAVMHKQDGVWCLFDAKGELITSGKTVKDMLVNLVLTIC